MMVSSGSLAAHNPQLIGPLGRYWAAINRYS